MKVSSLAFATLALSGVVEASTYSRIAALSGQSFLDAFSWEAIADPTHGRTNYVSLSTAQSLGLYSVSGDTVTLRADDKTVLKPSGPGRNTFRLQSKDKYKKHVAIFDVGHMPVGCGTWLSIWFVLCMTLIYTLTDSCRILATINREVGDNWPQGGEIDILEGVNNKGPNHSTLHTSRNCTMPAVRKMTGTSVGNNCDVYATGNAGCGVRFADKNSFGHEFNNAGGGWYAIERSSTHISTYFWERGSSSVPSEVKYPGGVVDPSTWGVPAAYFENTDCHFATHFGPMHIVINLAFCGDLANSLYRSSGCPSTCISYVNNNPEAFSRAYFEFNALNIYE